jgi:transposase
MEVVHERCAGLAIHKQPVVACLITPGPRGTSEKEVRRFGTMTAELLALADWLAAHAVTDVAMESTGVYWKPVWNLLEDRFTLLLANAQHIKAVPGRKTDVRDAEWIADLLRHGLIQGSFIPDRPHRELRELSRYRTSLVQERTREVNRLQKVLEGANIKLASVVKDVTGKSAREMLAGLVGGAPEPEALAAFARGRMREKLPQLAQALRGHFAEHQRFLVAQQLAHIDFLDEAIAQVSTEIDQRLSPAEQEAIPQLDTIPGVGPRIAEIILAEVGAR